MPFEAVLLLAHGTPSKVDEVPEYMQRVTGGRPIPQAVVDEVAHRFSAVGGSPLTRITLEQARLLGEAVQMPVYVGMRNWHPLIADTVEQMVKDGVRRAVVICLAPQNSRTSVGLYKRALDAAAHGRIQSHFVPEWFDHPELVRAFAERLASRRAQAPEAKVLFTAHSVPCRTIISAPETDAPPPVPTAGNSGDPYSWQAKRTAALVAERAGLPQWDFAFQSQGMSGGPWIGPTVESTLDAVAQQGAREVIIQPIGFVCDHVEILYDIDVQFREHAAPLGIRVLRPESLNTSPAFINALADLVRGAQNVSAAGQG
ncbi:MAG TPA: ferrochelatase [Terriglobales bacterium]|jgi:protoporphyrin/coproporphyrin ferrochelatase